MDEPLEFDEFGFTLRQFTGGDEPESFECQFTGGDEYDFWLDEEDRHYL